MLRKCSIYSNDIGCNWLNYLFIYSSDAVPDKMKAISYLRHASLFLSSTSVIVSHHMLSILVDIKLLCLSDLKYNSYYITKQTSLKLWIIKCLYSKYDQLLVCNEGVFIQNIWYHVYTSVFIYGLMDSVISNNIL